MTRFDLHPKWENSCFIMENPKGRFERGKFQPQRYYCTVLKMITERENSNEVVTNDIVIYVKLDKKSHFDINKLFSGILNDMRRANYTIIGKTDKVTPTELLNSYSEKVK